MVWILAVVALGMAGCTDFTADRGEAYDCACGVFTWNDRDLNMRMAEFEAIDSVNFRYHIVADLRSDDAIESRVDPSDIVLTFNTSFEGNSANFTYTEDNDFLTLEQIDAPGVGSSWTVTNAEFSILATDTTHNVMMTSLNASRGGNVVTASGDFYCAFND